MTNSPNDLLAPGAVDSPLEEVLSTLYRADPNGSRTARVFRSTFDQLYDGQRTGRYAWSQLYKTEKTHFGTLLEINLRRAFADVISDGRRLDYSISGHEIDCKYSYQEGGWMLPPECFGELLLVATADDYKSTWSLGVVRARAEYRRVGTNRDSKSGLNRDGRKAIRWVHRDAALPPNILLHLDPETLSAIFANQRSGQARVNELFRRVTGLRIGDNSLAAVAQQKDYPKRARSNGGARTALAPEGYLVLCGDYLNQRAIALALGVEVPQEGEYVSARVVPATVDGEGVAHISGSKWRLANPGEPILTAAPVIGG